MTASVHRTGKSHGDENFPVASMLIEKRHRAPILAFYDFVRTGDDVADSKTLTSAEKLALLDRMDGGLLGENDADPEAVRLREALRARGLTPRHARDLLDAFRQDATKRRYANFDELMGYCALSAMPVGRFVLDVHGESHATWPASDAICAALQIINHLQDCGEDFEDLDRAYLPQDDLERLGGDIAQLRGDRLTPPLRKTVDSLLMRTNVLLDAGSTLAAQVTNRRLALEIGVIHALARRITARLAVHDPLCDRVHLRKPEILAVTIGSVATTLRTRLARPSLRIQTGEEKG